MVGMSLEPFALDPMPLIFKEVDVRGAIIYRRADFDTAIALLAEGRIPSASLINDLVGFERAEATFQSLTGTGESAHQGAAGSLARPLT